MLLKINLDNVNKKTLTSALMFFNLYKDPHYVNMVPSAFIENNVPNILPFRGCKEEDNRVKESELVGEIDHVGFVGGINPALSGARVPIGYDEPCLDVVDENEECSELMQTICLVQADVTVNVNENLETREN